MCGIAGIFNYDKTPLPQGILKKMARVVKHRGPDGEGFWRDGFIGLGHRRLAILDLTSAAHQPMVSKDERYVIIYNGEIYNFQELKKHLENIGYIFHSASDTEVVLNAWSCWGKEALLKFNGMFAFAIWDRKKNTLALARDRYGTKPLYYRDDGRKLVFGSEIKSILQHPDYQVEVSHEALNEYFTFQNVFSDRTLFKGVRMVPSGTFMEYRLEEGRKNVEKYWDFHFEDTELFASEEEYIEELNRLFHQAVNRHLVSDVEIGSYLSGGTDSGAITSIASKNFPELKTFTAGFDLSSASGLEMAFDERNKAEYLSNQFKTEQYEVVLKAGDMEKVMPALTWHLEDLRVGQCYPNYYIHRLAAKFVKVSLGGIGGDELFAGYPWRYYRTVVNHDFDHYISKYYDYWSRLISDEEKQEFFNPSVYRDLGGYSTKEVFKSVLNNPNGPFHLNTPEQYINNSLYFEAKTFLQGLLLVEDKLSMANGLEMRVPFLDNDLVDFAMKVPVKYKLNNLREVKRLNENDPGPKTRKYFHQTNDGKILLRKVLNKYVPFQYANGIKQGFSAPDASWFKGESIDYIQTLLYNRKARIYDFVQPEMAMGKIDEHLSGRKNNRLLIWSLLSFEWWLKTFLP
ncbi:MAG: asparagine synthase (glutamine-hydrolyzing) [Bacteroidales bacterium]|nr:asparagine synthase (glutamine-hydrolyzing) [Bacteroidales bacterium]